MKNKKLFSYQEKKGKGGKIFPLFDSVWGLLALRCSVTLLNPLSFHRKTLSSLFVSAELLRSKTEKKEQRRILLAK
jgi:hypothetical protein